MKNNRNLIILMILVISSIIGYSWFVKQPAFNELMQWAQVNFWTYFTALVLLKVLAIVWPPLPGGLFTLGSIPIIGPLNAFIADLTGSIIGSIIAYHLGKKYGYKLLHKLFDLEVIERIKKVKINHKREVEAVILIRAFTFGISEAVSYGSGLIGIKLKNLLIGSIASSVIILPYFFLWQNVISFNMRNVFYNLLIMIPTAYIFYKFKGRYLE